MKMAKDLMNLLTIMLESHLEERRTLKLPRSCQILETSFVGIYNRMHSDMESVTLIEIIGVA